MLIWLLSPAVGLLGLLLLERLERQLVSSAAPDRELADPSSGPAASGAILPSTPIPRCTVTATDEAKRFAAWGLPR